MRVMNRRRFLTTLFLASGVALKTISESIAAVPVLGLLSKMRRKQQIPLKVGDVHKVHENTILHLPEKANDGDVIYLEISADSLRVPSVLKSQTAAILGEKDDLVLDTISNIRLPYSVSSNEWVLA